MKQLVILIALGVASAPSVTGAAEAWRELHGWILGERDRMAQDLEAAHGLLLARAREANDTQAIERLRDRVPAAREHGYGLLPEIIPSQPRKSQQPRRITYSLESLSTSHTRDIRDASLFARQVAAQPESPLGPRVDEFQRLHDRLRNLEDHLDYHTRWQVAVVEYREYFARRNRLVNRVRQLVEALERGAPQDEVDTLRSDVLEQVSSFVPTPGLRLERGPAGRATLPVEIATDIRDASFLQGVAEAIEEEYSESEAARAAGFAVRLRWRQIDPADLYADDPPQLGDSIDVETHLERFRPQALVLTTGAASTYALPRRAVLLGTSAISRRTLAHEFAHLLGFEDAYLRGYEGDPADPQGVVLVEWVGLSDDLIGNPGGGAVSREMIETLLEAYDP